MSDQQLIENTALLEAEIASLRRDLEIWRRNGGDILLEAEIARLRAALEPFGRNANAKSLSEALGHITREDLETARALAEEEK